MEHVDAMVGANLRRLRDERSLSYTQLAELTGVSKSMLRQIEIGDSSPTISTIWKIANGLGIPFTLLITPPNPSITQRGFTDNSPLLTPQEGYRGFPLVPYDAARNFEVYYIEIDPGVIYEAEEHSGSTEEIVMVYQGVFVITVQNEVSTVNPNEMLRFDASYPHQYHNPSNEMAKAVMIIAYSNR